MRAVFTTCDFCLKMAAFGCSIFFVLKKDDAIFYQGESFNHKSRRRSLHSTIDRRNCGTPTPSTPLAYQLCLPKSSIFRSDESCFHNMGSGDFCLKMAAFLAFQTPQSTEATMARSGSALGLPKFLLVHGQSRHECSTVSIS